MTTSAKSKAPPVVLARAGFESLPVPSTVCGYPVRDTLPVEWVRGKTEPKPKLGPPHPCGGLVVGALVYTPEFGPGPTWRRPALPHPYLCAEHLVVVAKALQVEVEKEMAARKQAAEFLAAVAELPTYYCESCGEVVPETCVVRECSKDDCASRFNMTEYGSNCDTCNRPFTRRLAEKGCPDCLDENECEEITTREKLAELMECDPTTGRPLSHSAKSD